MNAKPIYKSKTLWLNLIILIISILADITEGITLAPEVASWIAMANLMLRAITKQPIEFFDEK